MNIDNPGSGVKLKYCGCFPVFEEAEQARKGGGRSKTRIETSLC